MKEAVARMRALFSARFSARVSLDDRLTVGAVFGGAGTAEGPNLFLFLALK